MSALVAHEIRNPLNAIKGSVQYLRQKYPTEEVIEEYTSIVLKKVDRIVLFVESLLRLARLPTPQLSSLSLQDLFEAATAPFRDRAESQGVSFELVGGDGGLIRGDKDQLLELMQNVVENALDALPDGGRMRVVAKKMESAIEIRFDDDGEGIGEEMADRLFLPLVTSKRTGTGLGLVACRLVAENHGGRFALEPQPRGACFVLTLPRQEDDSA